MKEIETISLPLLPATSNDYMEVSIASTISYRVNDNRFLLTKIKDNPSTPSIKQYIQQNIAQFIIWVIAKLSLDEMLTSPDIITRELVSKLEQFFAELDTNLIAFSVNRIKYPDNITEAVELILEREKRIDAIISSIPSSSANTNLTEMRNQRLTIWDLESFERLVLGPAKAAKAENDKPVTDPSASPKPLKIRLGALSTPALVSEKRSLIPKLIKSYSPKTPSNIQKKPCSTFPVVNPLSHRFKLQRADWDCSRTLIWTIPQNDDHEGEIFDNKAAWRALESAGKTMHQEDLTRDKYVVTYLNGEEVTVTPHNALDVIFSYKPDFVLLFLKRTALGECIHAAHKEMERYAMIADILTRNGKEV